jgi:Domain of Unknown Function (DUF748)
METKTKYSVERKWFRLFYIFLPVVSAINTLLPFILKRMANKKLAAIEGFEGSINSISISFSAITIHDFLLDRKDIESALQHPFISAKKLNITFDRDELWKGIFTCDLHFDNLIFTHINNVEEFEKKDKPAPKHKSNITHLNIFPFNIKKLELNKASAHFIDHTVNPSVNLRAHSIYVTGYNITNIPGQGTATVAVLAQAYKGLLKASATVKLHEATPSFDVNLSIDNLELKELNTFFDSYGNFDVSNGTLGLYTEIAAADGKFKGYAKPVIKNLEIVGKEDKGQRLWQTICEGAVSSAIKIFENSSEDQLATKIRVEGKFSNADVNVWYAIAQTLRNAFISSLTPSIDHEINFNSLRRKKNP